MELLNGQTAIITGAASPRGLGKATAKLFAENGARVAILDLSTDQAKAAAADLPGDGHIGLACDVTHKAACTDATNATLEAFGQIDVLVNNAGITRDQIFMRMSDDEWQSVLDVNLTGVFNTVHPIWPGMRERKFGRIIVISSINGQKGQFAQVNYAATKAGDLGIVKSLAQEGARAGITANAICPGYIATEMVMAVPEKVRESIIGQIPAGRLGEPEEIARCVAFLASDDSGFINGSTISANGAQFFV